MSIRHLTRQQYREFAELTKSVGLALNLSSFKRMDKCWGFYSPWALLVCKDAQSESPEWHECSLITLAHSLDTDDVRAAGQSRPELDWGQLVDDEIYPFIILHEIGHRLDNFDQIGIMCVKDLEVRDECRRRVRRANEVLADRYAWSRIRPGEPIPLTETGKSSQEAICADLEYLNSHAPRITPKVKPLSGGQYRDVPDYMLATQSRAAFVGARVSPRLLYERTQYHRDYARANGRTLY